jgi:hypothetical protein
MQIQTPTPTQYASNKLIAEPLAVVRVALVDRLALVWQSKAQRGIGGKANSFVYTIHFKVNTLNRFSFV